MLQDTNIVERRVKKGLFQKQTSADPIKLPNAKKVLLDLTRRPLSQEALALSDNDILKSAREIDYPIYSKTIDQIYAVHESLMPVAEGMVTWLLNKEESNEPDYYAFARDGELLYDALWGLGQAGEKELSKRVHYLKTSCGMMKKEVDKQYFHEIGINKSRIKQGPLMIFLDSGLRGSLFYKVGNWVCSQEDLPNKNVQGYLIEKAGGVFDQMGFEDKPDESSAKLIIKGMENSPYREHVDPRCLNSTLCAFMQLMPKFTGRYVQTYQRFDGTWDVMPERNSLISKLKIQSNDSCADLDNRWTQSSIKKSYDWDVNADIIDPVASLLLQKKTLEYFADPNTHDRVYSKIKKNR